MLSRKAEMTIAAIFLIAALITVFIWVPFDSETAMIETFRRQTNMGDAFLPIVAGALICVCAAVQFLLSFRRTEDSDTEDPVIDGNALAFLFQLTGITVGSLLLMYWAGPLAVSLFVFQTGDEVLTYRQMRGTYPYKLLGFALGGFTLVFFTAALIEGKTKVARVVSSLLVVAALISVFDLPLDNVLLPPNGDW